MRRDITFVSWDAVGGAVMFAAADSHTGAGASAATTARTLSFSCPRSPTDDAPCEPARCEMTAVAAIGMIEDDPELLAAEGPDVRVAVDVATVDVAARSPKQCAWQTTDEAGMRCTATAAPGGEPTNQEICERCDVPDARITCSHYRTPIVTSLDHGRGSGRESLAATCAMGNVTSECVPGGAPCWVRQIEVTQRAPSPRL